MKKFFFQNSLGFIKPKQHCVLLNSLPGKINDKVAVFLKSLSLLHCVPLHVCRLCINFQDLCARLLGMAALRILLLTFISRFVIDLPRSEFG